MLKFIFGRASSGKTEKVLSLIGEDLSKGLRAVLLVPEQFSFEAERMLLERLGESRAANVTVLSFSRLYDEVGRICGGIAGTRMDESDRVILMGRALLSEQDELKCFGRFAGSEDFASICASAVSELKTAAARPEDIEAAAAAATGRTRRKLEDLARIMRRFNLQVGEKFIDPRDDLDRLYNMLKQTKYFAGKKVYIDGFKSFTGQELKIADRIIEQAEGVIVALCCPADPKEDELFDILTKTRKKLEQYAANRGINIEPPVELKESYYECDELRALEQGLFHSGEKYEKEAPHVTVCAAAMPADEADFAMYTVRRLVREKGMRYRDFAVIARDGSSYEQHIMRAAEKFGVACFIDTKVPVTSLPLFVMAQSALSVAMSLTSQELLKFLKTGLAGLSEDETARLENYAFIWNLKGNDWIKEWDMDPAGLRQTDGRDEEWVKAELAQLNELRKRAVEPLLRLRDSMKYGKTKDMAAALWRLTVDCNTAEGLAALADNFEKRGQFKEADLTRQSHGAFCGVLDRTVRCLNENADKKEFVSAFKLAVAGTELGSVPQTLDQVLFGSADRIRPQRPSAVIALGLNSGEWPRTAPAGGLLSPKDRELLCQSGIRVSNTLDEFAAEENFLCYSCLCAPSRYLFAVYHTVQGKNSTPPSYILSAIEETLPDCRREVWPRDCLDISDIETEDSAFWALAVALRDGGPESVALQRWFEDKPQWKSRLEALKRAGNKTPFELADATVKKIIPKKIKMSPTATETFCSCRFSYFCRYILKAKTLEKAELNVLQRGTMVHFVLENIVSGLGEKLGEADDGFIKSEVKRLCDEYVASIKGLDSVMDARMLYLFYRIRVQVTEVVLRLRDEFAQSGFKPYKCELYIGEGGQVKPLEFSAFGVTLVTSGKIDRVDRWGSYIRIVDYKTGHKTFRLSDLLAGQNMQMLLYLYTLMKSGGEYEAAKPAGILYMTAQRSDKEDNSLAMNGLLAEDSEMVTQMDSENAGRFVPRLQYNADGTLNKRTSGNTYVRPGDFNLIFCKIDRVMEDIAGKLSQGDIAVSPVDCAGEDACRYCDFKAVCGIENKEHQSVGRLPASEVIQILEQEANGQ